jgi:hypothetical protein
VDKKSGTHYVDFQCPAPRRTLKISAAFSVQFDIDVVNSICTYAAPKFHVLFTNYIVPVLAGYIETPTASHPAAMSASRVTRDEHIQRMFFAEGALRTLGN